MSSDGGLSPRVLVRCRSRDGTSQRIPDRPCPAVGLHARPGYSAMVRSSAPPRAIDREIAELSAVASLVGHEDTKQIEAEVRRRTSWVAPAPGGAPPAESDALRPRPLPADLSEFFNNNFGIALPRTPRRPPTSPQGTLGCDVEPVEYFEYQHATWRRLLELQESLSMDHCCEEYRAGRRRIATFGHQIPTLRELDTWVQSETGWRIVRADGYVEPAEFFGFVAERRFPCMDQIRHERELLYSPAPDMYHDIAGHLPMLFSEEISSYYELFGRVGMRARTPEQLLALDRLYWFTMEFGLVRQASQPVAYGAALLTGLSEMLTAGGENVVRSAFSIEEAIATPTDVSRPNGVLYVVDDFVSLIDELSRWATAERLL